METQAGTVPLSSVLAALGDAAYVVATAADLEMTTVTTARLWVPGEILADAPALLIIPLPGTSPRALAELAAHPRALALALCGPAAPEFDEESFSPSHHAVVRIPSLTDASVAITVVDELTDPHRQNELRKLTALQRSLSQALIQPEPVIELLKRLQRQISAVCLVVDPQGRVKESTGSIPLRLLLEQLRMTDAEAQRVSASGWQGLAIRLQSPRDANADGAGWLVVAARREGFPDAQNSAAAHIAATLIESARRTQLAARAQEDAIRAAALDEALELDPRPDSPELSSRLAALGFSVGTPLRVLAVAGTHPSLLSRSAQKTIQRAVEGALHAAEIPYLMTSRGGTTVLLAQATGDAISRALRPKRDDSPTYLAGIGREVQAVADVADSFADALIAIRAIRAGSPSGNTMSYEQFDFATRVFASVGLERMAEYSRTFLRPILSRQSTLEAVRVYFHLAQNTSATASALGIHQNTLRYRLAKVEEALGIDLSDPAAVTSLFLATTALDLVSLGAAKHLTLSGTVLIEDTEMTRTGIAPPNAGRAPSESITRSRPPRAPRY